MDIVTGRAGEIRGRVNGAERPVRVDLVTATGRLAVSLTTDAAGAYRFGDLPTGSYYVGFHRESASSSLVAEWWRNRTDGLGIAGATPVTLDGNILTNVSATLDPGGDITGRLVADDGSAVAGCLVRARAADGSLAIRWGRDRPSGAFGSAA